MEKSAGRANMKTLSRKQEATAVRQVKSMLRHTARKRQGSVRSRPNQLRDCGVLRDDEWPEPMHERADQLVVRFVAVESELEREFERRLVESSTLAFRVAYGVLRRREDAEDVAQEAFAKAYRSFRQLRDRERFRAWLVRMTWRLALDRQRSDRRRAARDRSAEALRHMSPVAQGFSPARHMSPVGQGFSPAVLEEIAARERAQCLWQAIDALPEKLRIVVVLAGIEEYDLQEVARLLNVPLGTVKSRMFAARERMREHLQCTMNRQQR